MATDLTKVQAVLLHVIRTFWAEKGYPPAQRELGRLMAKPLGSIQSGLERLERKGYVTWNRGIPRSLRLTTRGQLVQPSPNGVGLSTPQNTPKLAAPLGVRPSLQGKANDGL